METPNLKKQTAKKTGELFQKHSLNQDVFTLEEGDVTIQWPKQLSEASYQDLEDWLELIKRKAKRAIVKEDPAEGLL